MAGRSSRTSELRSEAIDNDDDDGGRQGSCSNFVAENPFFVKTFRAKLIEYQRQQQHQRTHF